MAQLYKLLVMIKAEAPTTTHQRKQKQYNIAKVDGPWFLLQLPCQLPRDTKCKRRRDSFSYHLFIFTVNPSCFLLCCSLPFCYLYYSLFYLPASLLVVAMVMVFKPLQRPIWMAKNTTWMYVLLLVFYWLFYASFRFLFFYHCLWLASSIRNDSFEATRFLCVQHLHGTGSMWHHMRNTPNAIMCSEHLWVIFRPFGRSCSCEDFPSINLQW